MLTTLWIMSVAAVVAMGAALVGRHAVMEGSVRVELERGRWQALACERRTVATIDSVLSAGSFDDATRIWRVLPAALRGAPLIAGCDVRLEAAGTRLDVNDVDEEMITNELDVIGLKDQAPALADALEDWIDADDDPRPSGVERPWYESQGRALPRNGPLAAVAELRRVKGFEKIGGLDSIMTTDPGRVSLATAPVAVLMSVPGMTQEAAAAIVDKQLAGTPVPDLLSIVGLLSDAASSALSSRFADAVRATTPDPDAWFVRVFVTRGTPPATVELEWRVIRTGKRCVVSSTKSRI
jgi:type II secretory pathway component PulK